MNDTEKMLLSSIYYEYSYEVAKPGTDEKIIAMAANASGIRDTARVLGISTDKVMDTLKNWRFDKPCQFTIYK